jgi:hypothetical protein
MPARASPADIRSPSHRLIKSWGGVSNAGAEHLSDADL